MNSSGFSNNILLSKGSEELFLDMDSKSTDIQPNLMNPEEELSKILEEDRLRNNSPICPMDFEDFTQELNLQPGLPEQDFDCTFTSIDLGNNSEPQGQVETMTYEEIGSLEMANKSTSPTVPIWTHKRETITKEQYLTLFKYITKSEDGCDAYAYKDFEIQEEGLKLRVILYVHYESLPTFSQNNEHFILCCKREIISNSHVDLLPPYLSFIWGVVEGDLISSQLLNHAFLLERVKKYLLQKSLQLFQSISEDKKKCTEFYCRFSARFKRGICEENSEANRNILSTFLRYFTSIGGNDQYSFKDYISRMIQKQTKIYYYISESREAFLNSILVKSAAEKDLEVIYMTIGEDDQIIQKLKHFEGFPLVSVAEESQVPTDKKEGNESLPSLDGNQSDGNHHEETFPRGPITANDDENDEDWDDSKASKRSPTREQPKRLARPKNLKDSTTIVGASASTSKADDSRTKRKSPEKKASSSPRANSRESVPKGRKGRKPQLIIQFNGTAMSMKEFERLPTSKRLEIEEVDNPFFDRKKLCFRTKWKYYPDNHKEKYNLEWANNVSRFRGGAQAVETFLKKFKVEAEDKNLYKQVKTSWKKIKEKEAEKLLIGPSNEDNQNESSGESSNQGRKSKSPQKTVPEKSKPRIHSPDKSKDLHGKRKSLKIILERTRSETPSSPRNPKEILKSSKKTKFSSQQSSVDLSNPAENSELTTSSHSKKTRNENESAGDEELHLHLREENSSNESWLLSSRTTRVANVLVENEGDQDETDDGIENPVGPINTDSTAAPKKSILEICNERPLQIKIPRVDTPKKITTPTQVPVEQTSPEVNPIVLEPPAYSTTSEISTSTSRGRNHEKHKRYEQSKIEKLSPEEYKIYKLNKRKKMRRRQKLKRQKRQELIKAVRAQLIDGLKIFSGNSVNSSI